MLMMDTEAPKICLPIRLARLASRNYHVIKECPIISDVVVHSIALRILLYWKRQMYCAVIMSKYEASSCIIVFKYIQHKQRARRS